MPPKLGILAGGGPLPARLIEACKAANRQIHVVAFEGETDPQTVADTPHQWFGIGAVGKVIASLRAAGAEEVVLAGPVRRPSLANLKLDLRGVKLMGRLARGGQGDDGLLSVVVDELEREGFRVVGADDLMADLLTPAGTLGRHEPDAEALDDIAIATRVALALGAVDVGQAVVVQHGVVLGVEAVEGTDALLERCASLGRPGGGGVLVKIKKPMQDRRVDLPTIGPRTVAVAHGAGLRGIAIEAGQTLIIDRAATVAAADAAGLFLKGITVERRQSNTNTEGEKS